MRTAGVILLALSAVALETQAPARLLVQGRVVVRGASTPVANARIVAAKIGGTQEDYRTTTSDAGGRFVLRDLAPGTYRVHADHPGHLRSEYGRTPVALTGTPIEVAERAAPPDLVIAMTPTGVIAGRVTIQGRPARNVWVRALRITYRDGRRSLSGQEYAASDDRGEYRLFGLSPGSYLISAMPPSRPRLEGDTLIVPVIPTNANGNRTELQSPATSENVSAAALETRVYPASYHPATFDPGAATVIEVSPGAVVLAIDVGLAETAIYHVRGRVNTQSLPTPPARVRLQIQPDGDFASVPIPSVEVQTGDFDIPGVPPGRYQLSVQAIGAPGERAGPLVITRVPVEVFDRDVEGITALLQPGVRVTGRVRVDDAIPPADQRPSVILNGVDGLPGPGLRRVEPDGTFVIENLAPGNYRWRLLPFGPGSRLAPWAKAVRFGGEEVSGRMIRIGADADGRSLEIDISTRTATLETIVLDDRRRPVAGALVIAIPEPAKRDPFEAYRSGITDAEGRVKLVGVAPGTYTLFATETVTPEEWQDPSILKRHQARGKAVTLSEGATQVVELRRTS